MLSVVSALSLTCSLILSTVVSASDTILHGSGFHLLNGGTCAQFKHLNNLTSDSCCPFRNDECYMLHFDTRFTARSKRACLIGVCMNCLTNTDWSFRLHYCNSDAIVTNFAIPQPQPATHAPTVVKTTNVNANLNVNYILNFTLNGWSIISRFFYLLSFQACYHEGAKYPNGYKTHQNCNKW